MSNMFQGEEYYAPTHTSRASHYNRRSNQNSAGYYDTTPTGMPDDRSSSGSNNAPRRENVQAWNNYVSNSQAYSNFVETSINAGTARYSYNNQYVEWNRNSDLLRARSLRANIQTYKDDQTLCNGGNTLACNRVGRRDNQDPAYVNPTQRSYQDFYLHQNRENPNPPPPPVEEVPSDIMGDGTSTNPVVEVPVNTDGTTEPPVDSTPVDSRQQQCEDGGGRWTADAGGACFNQAPVVPLPHEEPAPEDRTGRQEPEPDHSHRVVDPTASSGGSHSGKDGSKTQSGSDGVIHFDSGTNVNRTPPKNEVKFMLNNIRALSDPYNQDGRKCVSTKRLVE